MTRFLLFSALVAVTLTACDSSTDDGGPTEVQSVSDLAADPATRNPANGQVTDTHRFTLLSLRTGEVVLNYDDTERSDSASTQWDIGFRGTEIIINGGTSGPGAGVGVIVTAAFDEVTNALDPSYAYRRDGEATCPDVQTPVGPQPGTRRAVCGGSGNGWFTYTPFPGAQGGYVLPTPGRTLVLRLADNSGYAKVSFRSYYLGAPEPSAITVQSPDRYYTFDYVTNESGADLTAPTAP